MKRILLIIGILFSFSVPLLAQHVDTAWVRRYNGPGNGADLANAIAVGGPGNVYVTGPSFASSTDWDFATIKYNSNGDTAWIRRYNGPGSYIDEARAIARDGSGNVYVTGHSWGSGTGFDYATIKYYANGDTAWVRRYNGPGNGTDNATALAIDGSGNVYVTGASVGNTTGYDWATIKYTANGDTVWVRRYNGPGNSVDSANAIVVDGSGYVYVTGYSYDSSTDRDYLTIKYYPNGDTVWLRRYNGPGNGRDVATAIGIDDSSNAYVTGYSYGGATYDDYATIKYYANGDTAWVRRYNGPLGYTDRATAIVVKAGNVYVTGWSPGDAGDVDYATIKYSSNGDTLWVRRYNGPANSDDVARALTVDNTGSVYVTGGSVVSGTYLDYATVKYNSSGAQLWVRTYNGPLNVDDRANAIAIDTSGNRYGNVYVTGQSRGIGTDNDYATIKYAQFKCGDANCDGKVTISDMVWLVNYLFKGGPPPCPILKSGDANCDGDVTVADVIYLQSYLFQGGPPPCDPNGDGVPDCYGP